MNTAAGKIALTSIGVIIAASLLSGCSGREADTTAPDETVMVSEVLAVHTSIPGDAQCAECGMYVETEGRFSCIAATPDGKVMYFCDIGDMLIHLGKAGENEIALAYVRDYNTGGAVDAFKAFYLADAPVRTPMRFGIAAFEKRPDAEAFRAKEGGGTIYSYAGIQAERPYE